MLSPLLNEACRRHRISLHALRSLHLLALTPESVNQQGISQALRINKAMVVKAVDELEERRLAKRLMHPTDRRSRFVHLTAAGATLARKIAGELNRREKACNLAPKLSGETALALTEALLLISRLEMPR